jgi:hypothetical protein
MQDMIKWEVQLLLHLQCVLGLCWQLHRICLYDASFLIDIAVFSFSCLDQFILLIQRRGKTWAFLSLLLVTSEGLQEFLSTFRTSPLS